MTNSIEAFRPGERDSVEYVARKMKERMSKRVQFSLGFALSDEEVVELTDAIPDTIQELRFHHCQRSLMKTTLVRLKNTSIQRLILTGNQINNNLVQMVGELLQMDQGLVEVDLKHNALESTGACAVAKGICNHSTLECLDLSDCMVDNVGKDALIAAMFTNTSIRVLNLAGKMFHGTPTVQGIGNMLRTNKTLEELDLCRNRLCQSEVFDIACALAENQTLKSLRLSYLNTNARVAIRLGQSLTVNTTVLSIDLSGNQDIGDFGGIALAKGATKSGLQHLDLRSTGLGEAAMTVFADELLRNTSLKSLNLSKNRIGDEGARLVADTLTANRCLKTLSLSQCEISGDGAIYLSKRLRQMETIRELFMYQNPIDGAGYRALAEGLEDNMSLHEFGIEKKYLSPYCEKVLYLLRANQAGRRILRQDNVPISTWPKVLEKAATAEMIYYFISEKPDLIGS